MNQGLNRSKSFYRWVTVIGACISMGVALLSPSQAIAASTCNGVDLSLSLVQARWVPGSRGPMRMIEVVLRVRNQGGKNAGNSGVNFRPVTGSQAFVAPGTLRVGSISAGFERLLAVRIPVLLRQNATVKFPEIIASVSPESSQRDCFPGNNQVRVRPKRQPESPLNPGYGSGTGCVFNAIGNAPPVFVAGTNGVPEIAPSEEGPVSEQ